VIKAREAVEELVHRETKGWDTQDTEMLLSVFHPDMTWPWPPHQDAHDPKDWVWGMGRFNEARWRKVWQDLFDTHDLVHNKRIIQRIDITPEGDGGFAVVDVDTLWRNRKTGKDFHWQGRACKVYSKIGTEWKMTMHTGLLDYKNSTKVNR
jgi:ketosteroid isomerase-like protein